MSEQYEIRRMGEHRRAGSSAAVTIPAKFLAGKSADLRENCTTIYIVVRTNPENMRSKVVKLLRSVNVDKSGGTLPYW